MTTSSTKVQWSKALKNKYGRISYESRCGRFRIEKKVWGLPTTHTDYELCYVTNGRPTRESFETLTEAKEAAAYSVSPEGEADGYAVTTLPTEEPKSWYRIGC